MIGAVVRKELRAFWREGRLVLLGLSLFCIFVGVMVVSAAATTRAQAERDHIGATARSQWEQQGAKNPHRAAHFGIYVFKPALTLAAVEPGIGAQVGQSLWLEPHKRNLTRNSLAADAPSSARLGEPAPGFVLLVLVPLLIIGLGHNALSQERESGTLRMAHAAGVQGSALLVGKWVALVLAIGCALLPALLVGAWLLPGPASTDDMTRMAIFGVGLLGYYAIVAALTVALSASVQTSRSALLWLLALWVASVWVVPRLGAAGAQSVRPVPTGESFAAAVAGDIQRGLPGDGDAASRLATFEAQLLKDHGVTRLEDLPVGANAARRLFRDAYATRVYNLHFEKLWAQYGHQQNTLRLAGALSPVVPMRALSAALAGTDLAHQKHFEDAAETYREYFTVAMDEWDKQARSGVVSAEDKYAGDAQWQSIAPFAYQVPPVRFALAHAAPDLLALLGWLVAATLLVVVAGRRVQP